MKKLQELKQLLVIMALSGVGVLPNAAQSATFFPILPQVLLTGNMNEYSNGQASALIPVWGSRKGFVFLGGGGRYGGSQGWYGSVGLGARAIWHHQIWSAYVYGDRDDTAQGGLFWVVNPGVQWMNRSWDVTMNGYFPTNKQRAIPGLFWGDQLGMSQYVHFVGHVELDAQFRQFENVGDGGDGQVGYTFKHLHHLRFYLGGYYHSLNRAGHVNGGQIGMQLPLRHRLSVELSNSYDNIQRDVITFSLKYRLGGLPDDYSDDAPLTNRIMSPIPRHLGTLAMGSAIFSRNHLQRATDIGGGTVNDGEGGGGEVIPIPDGEGVERQHIWFFSANGVPFDPAKGLSQCTSTSPCSVNSSNFSQALVDQLNTLDPRTVFYFTRVTYNIPTQSTNARLTLNNGQSLWGRSGDYRLPANGLDRPVFIGGLNLSGDNKLSSLIINGINTQENVGIFAMNTSNISIDHVLVENYRGTDTTTPSAANKESATGVDIENSHDVAFNYVFVDNVIGISSGSDLSVTGGSATGMKLTNSDNITIKNSGVENIIGADGHASQGLYQMAQGGGKAIGINVSNSSNVTIENSIVRNLTGGNGGQSYGRGTLNAGDGGDVVGIDGGTTILNNTFLGSFIAGNGGNNFDTKGADFGSAGNAGSVIGITGVDSGATISGNTLAGIFTGGNGGSDDFEKGGNGGNVTGIIGAPGVSILNNIFSGTFIGGNGGISGKLAPSGGNGGNVTGIKPNGSSYLLNSFPSWPSQVKGGLGGQGNNNGLDGTVVQIGF